MKEIIGDLFAQEADAICLTTNGFVKADGCAVMGRGCARASAERWPGLPALLGCVIESVGVRVDCLTDQVEGRPVMLGEVMPYHVVAFPVKPDRGIDTGSSVVAHMRGRFGPGATVPGWALKALPSLIELSAVQLAGLALARGWKRIVLPRPGCGAGELAWEQVRPILARHLDDRFEVITWPSAGGRVAGADKAR